MPTLQSRHRWALYNRTPGAHTRRKLAREAASIAGPCPDYPPTAPVHGDWLGGCINGYTVIFRLMRGNGHRCDQWAAESDGSVVAQAAGLTALHDMLRAQWHKAPSLRMLSDRAAD